MFRKLIKQVIPLMAMIPLLSGCFVQNDSRPREKVIEYDEEVKLHDGSMIWVHIRRHYVLAGGGALGDPGAFKKNYVPKEVEISWDTGFPNVGRKSVFFDKNIYFIEKFDNVWYVVGYGVRYSKDLILGDSVNCRKVGLNINQDYDCQFTVDERNQLVNQELQNIDKVNMNILNIDGVNKNGDYNLDFLDNTKLSWIDKITLQSSQRESSRLVNRPYSYERINK